MRPLLACGVDICQRDTRKATTRHHTSRRHRKDTGRRHQEGHQYPEPRRTPAAGTTEDTSSNHGGHQHPERWRTPRSAPGRTPPDTTPPHEPWEDTTNDTRKDTTTDTRKNDIIYIIMYNNILFVNKCKETYTFCIKTLNSNLYITFLSKNVCWKQYIYYLCGRKQQTNNKR